MVPHSPCRSNRPPSNRRPSLFQRNDHGTIGRKRHTQSIRQHCADDQLNKSSVRIWRRLHPRLLLLRLRTSRKSIWTRPSLAASLKIQRPRHVQSNSVSSVYRLQDRPIFREVTIPVPFCKVR